MSLLRETLKIDSDSIIRTMGECYSPLKEQTDKNGGEEDSSQITIIEDCSEENE